MSNRLFLKIIVIGDSNVGKTAFLNRFANKTYSESYQVTIGSSIISKTVEFGDRLVELQMWDTAGQERFQSLGGSFFRGADACILAFDLTNLDSFKNLGVWKSDYLLQIDHNYREEFPFVIIGTKVDIKDERVVSHEDIANWCNANGIPIENYFETSAKENINVKEAIDKVLVIGCQRTFHQL